MNFEKNIFSNSEEGIDNSVASKGGADGEKAGGKFGKFWEKYKERAKSLARIAYLGGALGLVAIGGTEYLKNSEAYKTHIEAESSSERAKYEDLKEKILEKIGEKAIERIEDADRAAYFRHMSNSEKHTIPVSGFEDSGVSSQALAEMWTTGNGFYPEIWVKNIESIEYSKGDVDSPDYGSRYKASIFTVEANNIKPFLAFGRISFAGSSYWGDGAGSTARNLDYVFGHELAHSNDWESLQNLSRAERAELLLSVVERMNSENHFRTLMEEVTGEASYHSLIKMKDKTEESLARAREHFAKMAEGYFGNPDEMRAEHPEDFKIIDDLVNRGDEKFIPEAASMKREVFINENFANGVKN